MKARFKLLLVGATLLLFTGCTSASDYVAEMHNIGTVEWCITEVEQVCYDPVDLQEGDTAYTTLERLDEREDNVSIEATDYGPDLGYFVSSVNGVDSNAENFWKLYVNDAEAQVGISTITLLDGDKLEFIYSQVL